MIHFPVPSRERGAGSNNTCSILKKIYRTNKEVELVFVFEEIVESKSSETNAFQQELVEIYKKNGTRYVHRSETAEIERLFSDRAHEQGLLASSNWVVARGRDIFLVQLHGPIAFRSRPRKCFGLGWKGHAIWFDAEREYAFPEHGTKGKFSYTIYESSIEIPSSLSSCRREIIVAIREALSVFQDNIGEKENDIVVEITAQVQPHEAQRRARPGRFERPGAEVLKLAAR